MPGQHTEKAFESAIEEHLLAFGGYAKGDCDAFDRESGRIDELVEKINRSIVTLREYRTALISAAVTGKITIQEGAA